MQYHKKIILIRIHKIQKPLQIPKNTIFYDQKFNRTLLLLWIVSKNLEYMLVSVKNSIGKLKTDAQNRITGSEKTKNFLIKNEKKNKFNSLNVIGCNITRK